MSRSFAAKCDLCHILGVTIVGQNSEILRTQILGRGHKDGDSPNAGPYMLILLLMFLSI